MNKVIYTSYFRNLSELPDYIIPISICGKAPDWYKGRQYKKLAPKYDFFMKWKRDHNNEYYIKEFKSRVLNTLDINKVYSELTKDISEECTIAMICYEKPNDFCHRHLVADWFNQNGYIVKEFGY